MEKENDQEKPKGRVIAEFVLPNGIRQMRQNYEERRQEQVEKIAEGETADTVRVRAPIRVIREIAEESKERIENRDEQEMSVKEEFSEFATDLMKGIGFQIPATVKNIIDNTAGIAEENVNRMRERAKEKDEWTKEEIKQNTLEVVSNALASLGLKIRDGANTDELFDCVDENGNADFGELFAKTLNMFQVVPGNNPFSQVNASDILPPPKEPKEVEPKEED